MSDTDILTPRQRQILHEIERTGTIYFSTKTDRDYLAAARVYLDRFS